MEDKYFYFEDLETGEEFIVSAPCLPKAMDIAVANFGALAQYHYEITEEESERMGLDVY